MHNNNLATISTYILSSIFKSALDEYVDPHAGNMTAAYMCDESGDKLFILSFGKHIDV